MRFSFTCYESAAYREFRASCFVAICDHLGRILLREVPRVQTPPIIDGKLDRKAGWAVGIHDPTSSVERDEDEHGS